MTSSNNNITIDQWNKYQHNLQVLAIHIISQIGVTYSETSQQGSLTHGDRFILRLFLLSLPQVLRLLQLVNLRRVLPHHLQHESDVSVVWFSIRGQWPEWDKAWQSPWCCVSTPVPRSRQDAANHSTEGWITFMRTQELDFYLEEAGSKAVVCLVL